MSGVKKVCLLPRPHDLDYKNTDHWTVAKGGGTFWDAFEVLYLAHLPYEHENVA